jgi:hypothetical protein
MRKVSTLRGACSISFTAHPKADGKSYRERQVEMKREDDVNMTLLQKKYQGLVETIQDLKQEMISLRSARATIPPNQYNQIMYGLRVNLGTAIEDERRMRGALNCPCSTCPSFAMCAVLEIACKNFSTWLSRPRVKAKLSERLPPSLTVMAKISSEE